ncbi:alpha/beta hydrolase [Sporosarcina cascadiensis]|uniref:alpha/beta hydrolase n=1 Tax=Sporosarcina cascadiensis TaxID=2660747 RepID=UPI001E3A5ADB|nr:alpha/beta hydrolase [Sporosarcina cascadiensis]
MIQEDIIIEKNIVYGKAENEYLTADTFRLSNCSEKSPVLVLIHGGAFQTGSKEMYTEWGERLARENYFVMAINYRLATSTYASYPEVLEDIEEAMNWLVLHSNRLDIDVSRISMIGDSAGAYLAALFSLRKQPFSYRICAVVGVYGPYDLVMECKSLKAERKIQMFERLLGLTFEGNERAFKEASPISFINAAATRPTFDTSFYLITGKEDNIVNSFQSRIFFEKLKGANIDVELTEIDDIGHFWFNYIPGIKGGGVEDYPNNIIYPDIISYLKKINTQACNGNFSRRQIISIAKTENLQISDDKLEKER